jgi:putative multiple sugar transport system ATP-binding protein
MSVTDNTVCLVAGTGYGNWFFNYANAARTAKKYIEKLRVATSGIKQKAVNLSGGNQQKVVLAKWLLTHPEILIVDEPTHGIDVGAKFEIYELLMSIANEGKGIIMISSDMPELLGLCDRIIVLRQGKLSGELEAANASEEKIMTLAT